MESEQEKVVATLHTTVVEENQAAAQASWKSEKQSIDLIRRTIRETLSSAQDDSTKTMEQLEERLVQTIQQELEKARSEAERTERERKKAQKEEIRLKKMFDEQKNTLTNMLEEQ